jgi:hypothetical protein
MKYFRNTELAKLYNVSEKTVRNWIQAAKQGKIDLQLHEKDGKHWVANTTKNNALIEQQVKQGKKFKNTRGFKVISAPPKFYETYNKSQILDIISNLTIHKEIPIQYGYVDGGADSWDNYANRLIEEDTPNILNQTIDLLDMHASYIDRVIGSERTVNIVDLGPGNGLASRSTIARLLEQGRLNRYIAIDISQDILDIVEKNIHDWFGGRVAFEGHIRNFNEERFHDLFVQDYTGDDKTPVNLVFLLGGTLSNFRLPEHTLQVVNSSLGADDLLFYSGYLDTPYTRRYFDLSGAYNQDDQQQSGLIPSFLHMDETLCEYRQHFNEEKRCRVKQLIPKLDLELNFDIDGRIWRVELPKGHPILLWRHCHYNSLDIVSMLDRNGFDTMQATKSIDQNYILVASKIKLS